jgi:nucleotide-binding universal stress UspA family protein
MGTHGVRGIQRIIGSRALRVITNANRPFLIVQEKRIRQHGYKHIVLPVDFSRETKQKLAWAVEIGKKFDSTLHLLADHESDEFAARALNNNINYAENYLSERGCKFTVKKVNKGDNFPKETVRYAAALDADLIMIMTDPDLDLGDYIAGPDEQKIIGNEAQIPVMAINEVDHMQLKRAAMFQ